MLTIKQRRILEELDRDHKAGKLGNPNRRKKRRPNMTELLRRLHSTDMTPDEIAGLDDEVVNELASSSEG